MHDWKPAGWPVVVPRLICDDVDGMVAFLREVFAATGERQGDAPAIVDIGASRLMVSEGGGRRDDFRNLLYVYVVDTDAAFARALARGARPVENPTDLAYGDRRAMFVDPWGNGWQVATRRQGAAARKKGRDRSRP